MSGDVVLYRLISTSSWAIRGREQKAAAQRHVSWSPGRKGVHDAAVAGSRRRCGRGHLEARLSEAPSYRVPSPSAALLRLRRHPTWSVSTDMSMRPQTPAGLSGRSPTIRLETNGHIRATLGLGRGPAVRLRHRRCGSRPIPVQPENPERVQPIGLAIRLNSRGNRPDRLSSDAFSPSCPPGISRFAWLMCHLPR